MSVGKVVQRKRKEGWSEDASMLSRAGRTALGTRYRVVIVVGKGRSAIWVKAQRTRSRSEREYNTRIVVDRLLELWLWEIRPTVG
jgi:hypothetical protein